MDFFTDLVFAILIMTPFFIFWLKSVGKCISAYRSGVQENRRSLVRIVAKVLTVAPGFMTGFSDAVLPLFSPRKYARGERSLLVLLMEMSLYIMLFTPMAGLVHMSYISTYSTLEGIERRMAENSVISVYFILAAIFFFLPLLVGTGLVFHALFVFSRERREMKRAQATQDNANFQTVKDYTGPLYMDADEEDPRFLLNPKARKRYLIWPKIVFVLSIALSVLLFIFGVNGRAILTDIFNVNLSTARVWARRLQNISTFSFLLPFAGLSYWLIPRSRSKHQRLGLHRDEEGPFLYYYLPAESTAMADAESHNPHHYFRHLTKYRVKKRTIIIRPEGRTFPMYIPRTFFHDHLVIQALGELRDRTPLEK